MPIILEAVDHPVDHQVSYLEGLLLLLLLPNCFISGKCSCDLGTGVQVNEGIQRPSGQPFMTRDTSGSLLQGQA